MGMAEAGTKIWVEPNNDPKKKLKYAWRLSEYGDGTFVCVDTGMANKIVAEALHNHAIAEVPPYDAVKAEVKYADTSRIDFLLNPDSRVKTYIEVKSVTLSRQKGIAEFPDSVTARGTKHLHDLAAMARDGHHAVMFYLVQRTDCDICQLAADIDPTYADALDTARASGVSVIAYRSDLSTHGAKLGPKIKFL